MKISKIQILGPFNSGTNLISKILRSALKERVKLHYEGHTLFWKHDINKTKIKDFIENNKDTLFICIYKPVQNWICSIEKQCYTLKLDNDIKGWCTFCNKRYNNIVEIYNIYYNMYMELINTYDRVIFMNYYDFIRKYNARKYISDKLLPYQLNIKPNDDIIKILYQPSKRHGRSVKTAEIALKKRNINYNLINKNEPFRNMIKTYLNSDIINFFEGV